MSVSNMNAKAESLFQLRYLTHLGIATDSTVIIEQFFGASRADLVVDWSTLRHKTTRRIYYPIRSFADNIGFRYTLNQCNTRTISLRIRCTCRAAIHGEAPRPILSYGTCMATRCGAIGGGLKRRGIDGLSAHTLMWLEAQEITTSSSRQYDFGRRCL